MADVEEGRFHPGNNKSKPVITMIHTFLLIGKSPYNIILGLQLSDTNNESDVTEVLV